ncbi:hypothetical protein ABZ470_17730 [Streptosporangium sp. NPDC020072]|uniref:hypothetical protein n=1 Tax=Streptosporangium sp. NPDC020072 TaxID=3154788 RepID=UPI0034122A66
MIGSSRPGGRHRDGRPYSLVHRRVWDGPARAEAESLDQAWAGWTVLYSLGTRRFYGLCSWPSPQPVIVSDTTSEGLERRMREAEALLTLRMPTAEGRRPAGRRRLRSARRAA